jgi:Zn-finger nucleic acid-binding protein
LLTLPELHKCQACSVSLQETITGRVKVDQGYVCRGCYYDGLGDLVEDHPIFMPRPVRISATT